MHYDPTISLGNVLTVFAFMVCALFAWRDLSWRVRNIETWKESHMHTTAQIMENLSLMRQAVTTMEALAKGQERRITLVEDRIEWRSERPH